MSDREQLRQHLLTHSVKTGDFVLKSGLRSSWFIDSKQTVCSPEAMVLVADPVSFITAGIAASKGRMLRAFSVRKEVKDHGAGGRIAGALQPGDRVVITEDTVTRGTSLLEAAHAVQDFGAEVVLLTSLVDRGGSVAEMARREGLAFKAVFTAPDLGFDYEGGISFE